MAHIAKVVPDPEPHYPYHTFFTSCLSTSTAFPASSSPSSHHSPSSFPFIIDTGVTCHISPILSDFQSLHPIKPHPITGLGNHSVNTIGMGIIELKMPSGTLVLENAFYVPSSSVCLISVFLLGNTDYNTHFYPRQGHCYISDTKNIIIAHGSVSPDCKLFILSNFAVQHHPSPTTHSTAYYTSCLPDIDSWHKCLGHCRSRTILDMAHSKVVEGMPINTSSLAPKCEHCILGKQTRLPVPKILPILAICIP